MRKLGELMTETLQRIVLKVWHHIFQVVFLPQKMIYEPEFSCILLLLSMTKGMFKHVKLAYQSGQK